RGRRADERHDHAALARRAAQAADGRVGAGVTRVGGAAVGAVRGTRDGTLARIDAASRGSGARSEPDRAAAARRGRLARLPRCLPDCGGNGRGPDRSAADLRLLPADAPTWARPGAAADGGAPVNGLLVLSTVSLLSGGLLLAQFHFGR